MQASSDHSHQAIAPAAPRPTRGFTAPRPRHAIRTVAILAIGGCALLGTNLAACKKKPEPPPLAVMQKYQAQADRLCHAVVECIKEDTAKRLADQPRRRDMVLARMGQDLCVENQYQLIGNLSTEALGPRPADYDEALYQRYGRCVAAVEAADDCESRREQYFNHPECRGLRDAEPDA
ncbi:MAG: hypothetical protein RIF32_17835 [Leptospirales bacterium]